MSQPEGPEQKAGGGNLFTKRWGPAPVWVWMAAGLAAALLYAWWRSKTTATDSSSSDAGGSTEDLPGNLTPELIIQNYTESTPGATPPVSTTPTPSAPPTAPPPASGGSKPPPKSVPPPPGRKTPPKSPPPPATKTNVVTVAKWTANNPPWNSTLSGIAQHEGFGSDWKKIWDYPANADLKKRRGSPDQIRARDRIVIPPK